MQWTKEAIKERLLRSDRQVWRAVVAIYRLQTADEQVGDDTRHDNGIGFNSFDARLMSSFAKLIMRWEALPPGNRRPSPLSTVQMITARAKITKYAGQLEKLVKLKAAA